MALAMSGIRASGTEEQKKRWLPKFTDPDRLVLGGLGLTEPDSGSDALAMKTRAKRVSDGYVLRGTKQFCTNGGIADYHVIYANTDPAKGPAGIASFLVPKDTPGLRMGRKEKKLGVRASHTAQVILEDCHIPLDHRLGGEPDADNAGPGALGALTTLEATRPGVGAGALGIARAAYEFALDYAQDRKQFGKPLWQHEAIGFKLADMAMKIDAARLLIWRDGWMATQGRPFARAARPRAPGRAHARAPGRRRSHHGRPGRGRPRAAEDRRRAGQHAGAGRGVSGLGALQLDGRRDQEDGAQVARHQDGRHEPRTDPRSLQEGEGRVRQDRHPDQQRRHARPRRPDPKPVLRAVGPRRARQ